MGAIAALLAAGVTVGQGSSHREAPGITETPKVDGTDFYMFRSYEPGREGYRHARRQLRAAAGSVRRPELLHARPDAVYEIHIDNNGDARRGPHVPVPASRRRVKDLDLDGRRQDGAVPLINIGPIGPGRTTTALNVNETYTLNIIRGDAERHAPGRSPTSTGGGTRSSSRSTTSATSRSPTTPTYANSHIYDIAIPGCSQRPRVRRPAQGPFVVNLGETFDLVNITNPLGPR